MNTSFFRLSLALAGLAISPAHAAQGQDTDLNHRSVFENYRPYTEPEMANWPRANNTVHEIGGWRTYAREVDQQTPPEPDGPPRLAPDLSKGLKP